MFVIFCFALKELVCLQKNFNQVNAADTETGPAEQTPRVVAVSKSAGADVASLVLVAALIKLLVLFLT